MEAIASLRGPWFGNCSHQKWQHGCLSDALLSFVLFKLPSQVSRMPWIMCGTPVARVVQEERWPGGCRLKAGLDFVDISWLSVKIHFDLKENYRQALVPWEAGDWIWSSVAKLPMALLYSQRGTQTQRDQLLSSAFQAVLEVTWPKPPTHPLLSRLTGDILFLPSENQLSLSLNFSGHSRKYSWAFSSFSFHCATDTSVRTV